MRNKVLFENSVPCVTTCFIKALSFYKEYKGNDIQIIPKLLHAPVLSHTLAVGYFDGAAQNNVCGCGMVIWISKDHFFSLCMGGGSGSNTRAELLSLWGLLYVVSLIGISDIVVYEDSKIIIEWDKGVFGLQVLHLN